MINLIPIRRPLDPSKPLYQMPFNILSFKRNLPQPKTIHTPLHLPTRINPRRMIITMLPVVNRKSMPQNILVELLEVMTQFPETRGGRFLRVGERFAVNKGIFEEGMPFGWRAGFLETLSEELGNRLIVDWTGSEGLAAQNSRQVIEAIDTNCSRGCLQFSQPFIHFVSCFDSVEREVRSEVIFLVEGGVGFGVGGGGLAGRATTRQFKLP